MSGVIIAIDFPHQFKLEDRSSFPLLHSRTESKFPRRSSQNRHPYIPGSESHTHAGSHTHFLPQAHAPSHTLCGSKGPLEEATSMGKKYRNVEMRGKSRMI